MQTKLGLAVIVGKEELLIEKFIEQNELLVLFNEANFVCNYQDKCFEYLTEICKQKENWNVYYRDLNFDFASQRNYLNSLMRSKYIVRLDVDEVLSENLKLLIQDFKYKRDFYTVLRKNSVEGKIVSTDRTPFIFKNDSKIHWENKIHEYLFGYKTRGHLDETLFTLGHDKTHQRCETQNQFYYQNWKEQRDLINRNRKKKND